MDAPIFIGDELTATGFRLAGIETMIPALDEVGAALAEASERARLVIVTADCARRIPVAQLEAALIAETPAVAIIADVLLRTSPPDLARRLRVALGIEN